MKTESGSGSTACRGCSCDDWSTEDHDDMCVCVCRRVLCCDICGSILLAVVAVVAVAVVVLLKRFIGLGIGPMPSNTFSSRLSGPSSSSQPSTCARRTNFLVLTLNK
jgi:hypothetical protein